MNWLLIDRLVRLYNPFEHLGIPPTFDPMRYSPQSRYEYATRDARYHGRRIRYFMELARSGGQVDHILVDNRCMGNYVLPLPVILDGHHRVCGYLLAGRRKIRAAYGGRLDLLRYLEGTGPLPRE